MLERILGELSSLTATDNLELLGKVKTESGEFDEEKVLGTVKEVVVNRLMQVKNEAYKEAQRKTAKQLETELKKTYNYDGNEIGLDLIKNIVEKEKESVKTEPTTRDVLPDFSKWSVNDWAKIPHFTDTIQKGLESERKEKEALKQEFEQYKQREQVEGHKKRVKSILREKLISMNPSGLIEATKDDMIESFINSKFDLTKIEVTEKGELRFLKDDGELDLKDNLLPKSAEDVLKTTWWGGFNTVPQMNPTISPNSTSSNGLDKDIKTQLDSIFRDGNTSKYVQYVQSLPADRKTIAMDYWRKLTTK